MTVAQKWRSTQLATMMFDQLHEGEVLTTAKQQLNEAAAGKIPVRLHLSEAPRKAEKREICLRNDVNAQVTQGRSAKAAMRIGFRVDVECTLYRGLRWTTYPSFLMAQMQMA